MNKKHILIHRFYRSKEWQIAREIKIASAKGKCEKCDAPGEEVHHEVELTPQNVGNVDISINQDNLQLLCRSCHNKAHGRFRKCYQFDKEGNLLP